MLGKITAAALSDINEYISDKHYIRAILIFTAFLFAAVLLAWPTTDTRSFARPLIGPIFTYLFAAGTALFSITINSGLLKIKGIISISEWVKLGKFSSFEAAAGKSTAVIFQGLIIILFTLPASLLVMYAGGFSTRGLYQTLYLIFITFISFSWIGLFLRESLEHYLNYTVYIITGLFILGLIISDSSNSPSYLSVSYHYWILGVSGLLICDLILDIRGFLFS